MKLAFLLVSFQIPFTFVSGQGGLRLTAETKLGKENPNQLIYDSENSHRHGLQTRIIESDDTHRLLYATSARNLTGSSTCGNGICNNQETSSTCPEDCSNLQLETSEIGARGANGVMFYVKAKRDLNIYSLDMYTGTQSDNQQVQVYTRTGKYSGFEISANGWVKVYDNGSVDLMGGSRPTLLGGFDKSVSVPEGAFQSFFVWTPNNRIRYRVGSSEGALVTGNHMINFFEGVGTTSKFSGPFNEHIHSPRIFRGAIRYEAASFSANQGGDPLRAGTPITTRISCLGDQRNVRITIKTDKYGYESSYVFRKKGSSPDATPLFQGPNQSNYESSTLYQGTVCVDIGFYEFVIEDTFKDGLCCSAGQGFYSVEVQNDNGNWKEAVRGKEFASSKTHIIDVGQMESTMTARDKMYLVEHNKRRQEWHGRYNKEYVPLMWSKGLKDSSMEYAIKLLDTCQTDTPRHDPTCPYGENLARNKGSGGWGQLYTPEKILGRFVEREEGLRYPANNHLTTALWRGSHYVGCAEAETSYMVANHAGVETKHNCRVQVCRYARPGNCNMGAYRDKNTNINDWETPMLMDTSPCKPFCPPEGCFDQ